MDIVDRIIEELKREKEIKDFYFLAAKNGFKEGNPETDNS